MLHRTIKGSIECSGVGVVSFGVGSAVVSTRHPHLVERCADAPVPRPTKRLKAFKFLHS